ncbi:hypothetical protein U1Q18_005752, partial [Sarracenia purpurea var. burkii]
ICPSTLTEQPYAISISVCDYVFGGDSPVLGEDDSRFEVAALTTQPVTVAIADGLCRISLEYELRLFDPSARCLDLIYDGVEEDSDEKEVAGEDDLGDEVPAENRTEEGGEAKQVSSSDVEKSEGDDDESGVVETKSGDYEEEDESELSADEEDKLKGPRYCGYIAVVKVERSNGIEMYTPLQSPELLDQQKVVPMHSILTAPNSQNLASEEINYSRDFVESLLEKSLAKLQEDEVAGDTFVRWELGTCWIQHLQDKKNTEKYKKKLSSENPKKDMKVEKLGTPLRSLKNSKKNSDGSSMKLHSETSMSAAVLVNGEAENAVSPALQSQPETNANENELVLRRLLSDAAFTRLKDSETGLHRKVGSVP